MAMEFTVFDIALQCVYAMHVLEFLVRVFPEISGSYFEEAVWIHMF